MFSRVSVNAAFLALVASRDGIESVDGKNLNQFAVEQVNYMLGDNAQRSGSNCYSFLIGYGNNFPRQPHHRAAWVFFIYGPSTLNIRLLQYTC